MRSVGLCKYSQWRRSLISCIPGGLDKPTLYQVTPVGLSQQYKSQQDLPDKIFYVKGCRLYFSRGRLKPCDAGGMYKLLDSSVSRTSHRKCC